MTLLLFFARPQAIKAIGPGPCKKEEVITSRIYDPSSVYVWCFLIMQQEQEHEQVQERVQVQEQALRYVILHSSPFALRFPPGYIH